ncbi:hypothetical protein [Candidatus Uabimicrobium amorphum]|uniref:PEP-CTERM protein-sorting domain-containing protein n=1 Tax=Uabimicrobium amorphum TaxID=2596890 RepID=A0A5S9ILP6_UABAM|nr:hypothetical protein [Candidatus Uabimicrobium amorphum]BBM84198.1 hypothetical protein UABAM_02554 [Candidatus Uabimicrobium amorphum]
MKMKLNLALISLIFFVPPLFSAPIVILDANDFNNNPFHHIDFEVASGQNTTTGINNFLADKNATFSIPFGTLNQSSRDDTNPFPNGDSDGGAVSGVGHARFDINTGLDIRLTFANGVDAVGFFLGGAIGAIANFKVKLADGSDLLFDPLDHIPGVPDFSPSSEAINGFFGVDSNGGPLITEIIYEHSGDVVSVDDIFFGTATASGSIGPQQFAENFDINSSSIPLPQAGQGQAPPIPEPTTFIALLLGFFLIRIYKKSN